MTTAVLYGLTLCPTVYWYDSAEFAAHAASLGVPHPPGYPLYTLVAHVFTWLPGEAAWGVNIMSLVFGVIAVVLAFRIVRLLGGSLQAAVVGAATLATLRTMWANAVVAEVYTPGLVMTFGVLWMLLRADESRRPRGLVLAGLVAGLGVGMHMSIATCGLGFAWLVWTYGLPQRIHPRVLAEDIGPRIRRSLSSGVAAAGGLLIFVYIPLRKFERWDLEEWVIFRKNATGGAFKRKFLKDYDLVDRLEFVGDIYVDNLLVVGLVLAAVGLVWLVSQRPRHGVGLLLLGAGNLWWFFNYKVPDLDVFLLPGMVVLSLGVGLAADALTHRLQRRHRAAGHLGWALLVLPATLIRSNYEAVDLSGATEAAEYGRAACAAVPADARVVTFSSPVEWRFYSVFIYQQEALGRCVDVGIWKKPKIDSLHRALRRRQRIFTFRDLKILRSNFELVPKGPLWELTVAGRQAPVRAHHKPSRRAP